MPSATQIERLAAAMHALRPAWRTDSLITFLTAHHADRAYADLVIAAMWVTADERTQTPALLNQHGPWWVAAGLSTASPTPTVGPGADPRCELPGHEHERARHCRCCRAERIGAEPVREGRKTGQTSGRTTGPPTPAVEAPRHPQMANPAPTRGDSR